MNAKVLEEARVGVTTELELSSLDKDEEKECCECPPQDVGQLEKEIDEVGQCCCRLIYIKVSL